MDGADHGASREEGTKMSRRVILIGLTVAAIWGGVLAVSRGVTAAPSTVGNERGAAAESPGAARGWWRF